MRHLRERKGQSESVTREVQGDKKRWFGEAKTANGDVGVPGLGMPPPGVLRKEFGID